MKKTIKFKIMSLPSFVYLSIPSSSPAKYVSYNQTTNSFTYTSTPTTAWFTGQSANKCSLYVIVNSQLLYWAGSNGNYILQNTLYDW